MNSAPRSGLLVPAGSFLLALMLSATIGPHGVALVRSATDPTHPEEDCKITKVTILPILSTETVARPIEDVVPDAGQVVTQNNYQLVLGRDQQPILFGPNAGPGGGSLAYVGKAHPDDDSDHDIVLVLVEGKSKLKTVTVVVDCMDVDDPTAKDPPLPPGANPPADNPLLKRFNAVQNQVLARQGLPVKAQIQDVFCGGHLYNARGNLVPDLPTLDWDNLCFDNRTTVTKTPPSGQWVKGEALTKKEVKALEPLGLTQGSFKDIQHVGQANNQLDASHTHVEITIQCDRARADVAVADGAFKKYFLLQIPSQPGDNVRVAAICSESKSSKVINDILKPVIPLQNDTLARLVVRTEYTPGDPPGPRSSKGPCRLGDIQFKDLPDEKIQISQLLTVWRRLHFEADVMGGTPLDRFPAPLVKDPVETADDDGQILPAIKPDLTLMRAAFLPMFVEAVNDLPLKNPLKDRESSDDHNKHPVLDFARNLNLVNSKAVFDAAKSKFDNQDDLPMYWLLHLWGAYEGSYPESNDPEIGASIDRVLAGITGGVGGGSSTSADNIQAKTAYVTSTVMQETIRDVAAKTRDVTFGQPQTNGQIQKGSEKAIIQRAYVHEAGHQFLDRVEHFEGWMWPLVVWTGAGDPAGLGQTFSERHQALMRAVLSP
jgi:hypothetical protein